jgi:hypothetical protein
MFQKKTQKKLKYKFHILLVSATWDYGRIFMTHQNDFFTS